MKKLNVTLAAVTISGVFASSALAATITESTTIGGGVFAPSTKVGLKVISAANSYAATSAHVSGTYQYGSGGGTPFTGDASKILQKAYTASSGATVGDPEAPSSATALPSGFQ